jgi:N-acetylglucosamine-6-phosphate deacetylase
LNPARVTGTRNKGKIAAGADADFVVLRPNGEVAATVVKGALLR